MDATQLLYFKTVCRCGSYAKAAETLFISPQGLNKAMHKLEEELGVSLFERTGTGLALTEYGEILFRNCGSYLEEHQRILNELRTEKEHGDLTLSIGVKAGFAEAIEKDFLLNFILDNPDLHIKIRAFPNDALSSAMQDPERSVWILPGNYDTSLFRPILERREKMFLIVGESHPLAKKKTISIEELKGETLVGLPHDIGQQASVSKAMADHFMPEPDYLFDIADREFTMRLIQSGRAVSFNSGWAYKNRPGIVRVDFNDLDVRVKASIVVRKDSCQTTALQRFEKFATSWQTGKKRRIVTE